jgi:hypothetical protein
MDNHRRWIAPIVLCLGALMIVLDGTLLRPQPQGAHRDAHPEGIGPPVTVGGD